MEGCKNFLTGGRRLVEGWMNQQTEKNTIRKKKENEKKMNEIYNGKGENKGKN